MKAAVSAAAIGLMHKATQRDTEVMAITWMGAFQTFDSESHLIPAAVRAISKSMQQELMLRREEMTVESN